MGTKQSVFQPDHSGKHPQVQARPGLTVNHDTSDRTHEFLAHQDQGLGRRPGKPKAFGPTAIHGGMHRSTIGDAGIKTERRS
jgi:hypothetical protein